MTSENDNSDGADVMNTRDTRAAEYVIGLLSAEDRAAFEQAAAENLEMMRDVAFWRDSLQPLADTVDPVAPSDDLFAAIEAAVEGEPQPGSTTIRQNDGEWLQLFEGVFKKSLLVDHTEGAESFLLRLEPGASCPAHSHSKTEECLVMEGEMIIGNARFRAGDYHAAPATIPHLPITSEIGALLFVRGELHA